MQTLKLGQSDLKVSGLGLGCMGMSEFYGPTDDEESIRTLSLAEELGVTFLDTADMYGQGDNERLIGKFIKGRRNKFTIATKFGIVREADGGYARGINNSPEYIRQACEASLKRLNVDTIDLYYAHRLNKDHPIEETVGGMADLVKEGKIRAIGLCEVSPLTLRRAQSVHPIAAVQSEYSLWTREPELHLLPACRDLGISFVAYCPLGRGFLTGDLMSMEQLSSDDFRRSSPRFQDSNFQFNLRLLGEMNDIAKARGCTGAQLALAWIYAKNASVIPIPGTRKRIHLSENYNAVSIELTEEETRRLDEAFPIGAAAGERYTSEGMKGVDI